MNLSMMLEAHGEASIEVEQLLPQATINVMDLGTGAFAVTNLAPEVGSQELQAQLAVLGQPGAPDLADPADRFR